MIHKFRAVIPGKLYRGSHPNAHDVLMLKETIGVRKIVSLDKETGDKIDRACKMLHIEHIKLYIDDTKASLIHFLSQDFKKVFLEGGPVFYGCKFGKDRTGLATALIKCKFLGMKPEAAIKEAKSLGFGIGVPEKVVSLYEKIIRNCKPSKDDNSADIVSNEREYIGDSRDSFLDEARQGSFAPYLDHTKQNPMDALYNYTVEQEPTRQNYDQELPLNEHNVNEEGASDPLVGIFNNDSGQFGAAPTQNFGGFIGD